MARDVLLMQERIYTKLDVAKLDGFKLSFHTVENGATGLHDLLGGYMEVVRIPNQDPFAGLIGLADEDGVGKGLLVNYAASVLVGADPTQPTAHTTIVGPLLIVRAAGPDFVSLTNEDRKLLTDHVIAVIPF